MAPKKEYSIKSELISTFAKALAHPARVAICEFIAKQGECYFGKIFDEIPLAKATVSQHLTELKNAGLLNSEELPPRVKYSINKENWELAHLILTDFFKQIAECEPEAAETEAEQESAE